jgi:DNA-binding transcriptional LysR family regulator
MIGGGDGMMELRHLRYFAAVAETLSFTQAAADCGVAQSALSQQVARLEKDVGAVLFTRSSRQVRLTEAGAVLLPWARRLLADAEQAGADVAALAGLRRGRLRLGVIQTVAGAVDLAAVLGDYHERHPGIELSVSYDTSSALLAAVLDGALDLALVGLGAERIPAGLEHRVLDEDRLVAVVAAGHPLAGRRHVDLAELSADELIWFSRGTGLRSAVEAACARAGLNPVPRFEVGMITEMVRLAAHGLGVAIVPGRAVAGGPDAAPDGASVLRLTDPEAVHRVVLAHRADRLSAAAAAMVTAMDQQRRSNRSH